MMAKARFEWYGLEELVRRLESAATVPAMVVVEAYHQSAGGRTAQLNAQIRYVQAANQRNPWFLAKAEIDNLSARVRAAAADGGLTNRRVLADLARDVGDAMKQAYLRNVQSNRGERGPMRPLSERTLKRKEKKGRQGNPILVDTGALLESIAMRVRFAG